MASGGGSKTLAPGFSEVEVLVANRDAGEQPRVFRLLITPDQKFAIQDSTPVPFGAHPFPKREKFWTRRLMAHPAVPPKRIS